MDDTEIDRTITLPRALGLLRRGGGRVSAEIPKGPRGGGRHRHQIIRTESEELASGWGCGCRRPTR